MKKDEVYTINIEDVDVDGNGIGHIGGMTVFVHGALPGETVRIKIIKVKKTFAVAIVLSFDLPSPFRRVPPCPVYKRCGGCSVMHAGYPSQLEMKYNRVKNCMERIARIDTEVSYPLPMRNEFRYRNKAAFPVGTENGLVVAGFYKKRSHEICDVPDCMLQSPDTALLMGQIKSWITHDKISIYNEINHIGLLRHIIVRTNSRREAMLVLVINGDTVPGFRHLLQRVEYTIPNLKSIVLSHNTQKGNVILGDRETVLYGPGYLTEEIDGLVFRVSAHSFMQVNYSGMCMLYDTLFRMLKLKGDEVVADLYCGVGTITLMAAKRAKQVYGIEIVEDAIKSANKNAEINGIANVKFLCGDAEQEFENIKREAGWIDIIIVDPPRKGLSEKVIFDIAGVNPKKIGYVSCDPSTLARDISVFADLGYKPQIIQPVDMFPQTTHVETVVLLSKRKADDYLKAEIDLDEIDATSTERKATYEEIKKYVAEHNEGEGI